MADNDLEIKFGADVAGLTAGASQAKSEIDRLVQAIALLQKTVGAAARVMTSELTGALQGVGASAATASTRVKAHGEALENAGKSGHRGASEMSFFTLELRALADEAMSGRWRNFEGSLTRIIGHSAGMIAGFVKANPVVSALGAAAAVAGTSLFFLDRALTEAADASRTIQMDAASNQFFMAKEKADALRDSIRSIANVSAEDAEKIYKPFDRLGEAGEILARMAAEFIPGLTDKEKDLGKVSEDVAKYMLDLTGAGKAFVDTSPASTAAIRKQYDEFIASNNKAEAYITILKLLAPTVNAVAKEHAMASAKIYDHAAALERSRMTGETVAEAEKHIDSAVDDVNAKFERGAAVTEKYAEQLRGLSFAADTARRALADGFKIDTVGAQMKSNAALIDELKAGLASLPDRSRDAANQLSHDLDLALMKQRELTDQQTRQNQKAGDPASRDTLGQDESAYQHLENTWRGTQAGMKQAAVDFWQKASQTSGLSVTEQIAITQKLEAAQKALYDEQTKAGTKADKDLLGAARERISETISLEERATSEKLKQYGDDLSHHRLSDATYLSELKARLAEELSTIQASYARELALAGLTATQKAALRKQESVEAQKVADQISDAERKSADDVQTKWESAASMIEGAWNSQLRGLLAGTTSWGTAMKNIAADLTIKLIEEAEKAAVQWVIVEAMKTNASVAGAAARTAAENESAAAGLGGMIANAIHAITIDAGQASAGVTAFLAPILGPAAPAAGAAAGSSVLAMAAFDIGAWNIPQDQLAMIHRNELVMPAAEAGAFRSMLSEAAGGDDRGAGGRVSVHPTTNIHVHATDSASIASWARNNGAQLAKGINEASRHGALLGLRRLR